MWLSAPMWITLLDPFALHAPFHHLRPVVFGLMEKDVLCACSIPPLMAGGLWSTGKGCAMCDYDHDAKRGG